MEKLARALKDAVGEPPRTGAGRAQPSAWSVVGADQLHVEVAAYTGTLAAASQRRLSRCSLRLAALWTCMSWLVARAGWRRPEEVSSTSSNPFPPQVCRVHARPERLPHRGHDPRLAEGRRDRIRGALFAPRLFACFASCFDRRALVSECLAVRFRAVGAYSLSHGRMHRSRSCLVPPSCPARVRSVDVCVCCHCTSYVLCRRLESLLHVDRILPLLEPGDPSRHWIAGYAPGACIGHRAHWRRLGHCTRQLLARLCLRAERAVYVPWVSCVDYLQHVSI